MAKKNLLFSAPPFEVERVIKRLGADLRTARLRRNLTVAQVAEKIGTGPRAVLDAEKGKPSTGFAVYAALLWAHDLLDQLDEVAIPARDERGMALARAHDRKRPRFSKKLRDNL